jgi:hypothetical protein
VASKTFKTRITKKGPFFKADPAKTLAENIHVMMLALAKEGARDVRGQLRVGTGGRDPVSKLGGRVADHIAGELRRRPAGPKYSAVVIVRRRGLSREYAIALSSAALYLEKTVHAFRKTRGRILRSRAINAAELLKGLR